MCPIPEPRKNILLGARARPIGFAMTLSGKAVTTSYSALERANWKSSLPFFIPSCGSPTGTQVPLSQTMTVPAPYCFGGIVPSNAPELSGWSSTWMATRFWEGFRTSKQAKVGPECAPTGVPMKLAALCIASLALAGCASSIKEVDTSKAHPECVRQCAASYSSCVTGSARSSTLQACHDAYQVCVNTCSAKATAVQRSPTDDGGPSKSPDHASTPQGPITRRSGSSANYAGRVRAAIRPNITYPDIDTVKGNPSAEFDVNLAPDGTIVGVKLRSSSGVPGWDEAAERAIRRTDKLPRGADGSVYSPMTIRLGPKD
jgi:TonB family protein